MERRERRASSDSRGSVGAARNCLEAYDPAQQTINHFKGLGNVVVLMGGEHQNFVGEQREKGRNVPVLAEEFSAEPVELGSGGVK